MIIILDIFICLKKTFVLEIMHCILIIINPLPTIYIIGWQWKNLIIPWISN